MPTHRTQAPSPWELRAGTAEAVAYDLPLAAARSSYAHLADVDPSVVAVGSQVSVFAGLIAANLPEPGCMIIHDHRPLGSGGAVRAG
jgi:hypothetical protein